MDVLFGKQVGMGTRSGKKTFVLINRVYKNPIEFNIASDPSAGGL